MGPLSGFVAGSFSWSSRPPAFARQMARSHRDFVRFGLALPSCSGTGRPATGLWSGPESMSRPTSCQLSEEPSPPWLWSGPESMSRTNFLPVVRGAVVSVVVVWSGVDVLTNLLRVVRGAVVSVVVVWSGVDVLTSFLRVVRGAVVSVVVVWSGVDVLTNFLPVVG